MTTWKELLKDSEGALSFLKGIESQIPEGLVREMFNCVLDVLGAAMSDDDAYKLRKLNALENAGVDNWEWYDDAMEELHNEENEEDDE